MGGRIVVGVDGSTESRHALRWAIEEARLRRAEVRAVHVYHYEPAVRMVTYAPYGPMGDATLDVATDRWEREAVEAERRAEALLAHVLRDTDTSGVVVTPEAIRDRRPAPTLVELSRGADLLVVGSRGRGGFGGLALGSCSHQCAQHAACPLVIVRPTS